MVSFCQLVHPGSFIWVSATVAIFQFDTIKCYCSADFACHSFLHFSFPEANSNKPHKGPGTGWPFYRTIGHNQTRCAAYRQTLLGHRNLFCYCYCPGHCLRPAFCNRYEHILLCPCLSYRRHPSGYRPVSNNLSSRFHLLFFAERNPHANETARGKHPGSGNSIYNSLGPGLSG